MEACKEFLGPSSYIAKGETTRNRPDAADIKLQTVDMPTIAKDYFNDADVYADTMCVNNVPFWTSVSHDLHYGTIGLAANLNFLPLSMKS